MIGCRKSFHLEECNSEVSFLSETPLNSTPLPQLRANSLILKKDKEVELTASDDCLSRKSNPELGKSLNHNSPTAHILTLGNSKYETVPLGLSQDIPDVFL